MVKQTVEEGIYLFIAKGGLPYVGQSQHIETRLSQHIGKKLESIDKVFARFHFKLGNDKLLRETIEQVILNSIGIKKVHLKNRVNPIGKNGRKNPFNPDEMLSIDNLIDMVKDKICK